MLTFKIELHRLDNALQTAKFNNQNGTKNVLSPTLVCKGV